MNDSKSCPECNQPLKNGYIVSSRRISWSESGESVWTDVKSEVLIKDAWFKLKKTPALKCETCHLVMFKPQ
ncbi:PF20097 family protein [Jeotgalibacillus alimentarius]|uniref:PF20097 family protein n=1 Tax=Jeotgalibacillus alimentarius TaxID=135826 RepID=UPI000596E620|nr:PF20097 family protein [Jeotgalibacillus alimentarius]